MDRPHMHRFYSPPDLCKAAIITLPRAEAHHARDVLRVRRSEKVIVLNGAGDQFLCEVLDPARGDLQLQVLERHSAPSPAQRLTLLQSVPKGKLTESIIQKATELGVSRIVPLLTERTTVRLDDKEASQKGLKWQQVAIEAIKQSGALWLPRIEKSMTPAAYFTLRESFELSLVGSLKPGARHPRECFREFQTAHGRNPETVAVWIGPEGDFTPAEISAIQDTGALPISLGPLVLRVETAAIYALSVIQYELTAGRP